jgi:hypothetical protein
MTAVIPAAVRTVMGSVRLQIMATSKLNTRVKMMRIGSPYFLTTSIQQPSIMAMAIYKTVRPIITGVL